jgi:hypothetical protein
VTVVHLARRANGIGCVRKFVDSYLEHDAGVSHDLHVICKGFDRDDEVKREFDRTGRPCTFAPISDAGFDIGAYLGCATTLGTEYVCFLNSHSEIRAAAWLAKLMDAVRSERVGVAGASASFESTFSSSVDLIPHQWRGLIRKPSEIAPWLGTLVRAARTFPPRPNPHLRTNAFVIRSEVFRNLAFHGNDRRAALAFESGYGSMTRQLRRRGLEPVVVGADGRLFRMDAWPESATFRYAGQENLLVHDNHTRHYQNATPEVRRQFGQMAWGDRYRG